jgi:hypothetical protein
VNDTDDFSFAVFDKDGALILPVIARVIRVPADQFDIFCNVLLCSF